MHDNLPIKVTSGVNPGVLSKGTCVRILLTSELIDHKPLFCMG